MSLPNGSKNSKLAILSTIFGARLSAGSPTCVWIVDAASQSVGNYPLVKLFTEEFGIASLCFFERSVNEPRCQKVVFCYLYDCLGEGCGIVFGNDIRPISVSCRVHVVASPRSENYDWSARHEILKQFCRENCAHLVR